MLKDGHYFCFFHGFQLPGRLARSDLANYSENFLFIILHSREPLWTIKPVKSRLHINQWNIIANCCLWAWGTLYMLGNIQLAPRFTQEHSPIQQENEHYSNWENEHLGSFSCWQWLETLIIELPCFVFHYLSKALVGKKATVVPLCPQGICSETSSGCLRPQIVLNPIYTMCFLYMHTHDKV